mmetsp:Transcript_29889/g.78403  ORF Transcript_29889/g.78403 Transcript_29889/m.78403 type:complete len:149 (-) Transcript_29889:621-1067(-)
MENSLDPDFIGNRGPEFDAKPRRCTAGMLRKQSLLIRGLYVYQVQLWLGHFTNSRILALQSESYFADVGATIARVRSFLGESNDVDSGSVRKATHDQQNSRAHGQQLDAEVAAKLTQLYAPYVDMLNDILKRNAMGNVLWPRFNDVKH